MELLSRMHEVELDVESGTCGTSIYAACLSGHSEVVKIHLEREVNVNLDMPGESPLEAATVEGHDEVVELLEKHEAIKTKEVTRLSKFSDRHSQNERGQV